MPSFDLILQEIGHTNVGEIKTHIFTRTFPSSRIDLDVKKHPKLSPIDFSTSGSMNSNGSCGKPNQTGSELGLTHSGTKKGFQIETLTKTLLNQWNELLRTSSLQWGDSKTKT